jgi:hypothetical protein
MKRKLYLDIAVFIVILGGFGAFIFMQQHTPATEAQTQEAVDASAAGCCGASTVEGETSPETAGGCCGTPAPETAQNDEVEQQVQPSGTPETDKTSPKTPQSEDADEGGCGCGG